tara:strand:+ start:53885 stop:55534 length:1650 start_codon:yes stop_codon:yes gene_type:complete
MSIKQPLLSAPVACSIAPMLAVVVFCFGGQSATAAMKPDVLMILVDDLRPMLGCYGDLHVKTPNIDRLAKRGVLFERAYCQYAKCGTSRLSLMTGLRPDSIGVFSNRDKDVSIFRKRRPDALSLSKWLGQHGYFTQSFGKIDHDGWHVDADWSLPPSPGREKEILEIADPIDPTKPTIIADRLACPAIQSPDVDDEHLYAGRMTSQLLASMRQRLQHHAASAQRSVSEGPTDAKAGQPELRSPAFYAVGFRRPHLPLVAPQRYFDLYQPDESWLATRAIPADGSPMMAWFNSDGYVGSARNVGLVLPSPPSNREEAMRWNGYELRSYLGIPNQGPIERSLQLDVLQAYAACISYVDAQIGRLLDQLQSTGQLENTIVILCSDHGWHLGEQSAWSKMTNFEVATRVPLIIAAPNIKPGRSQSLAELVDVYPTLCDLTGVPSAPHLEGESLIESLTDPSGIQQRVATSQHARFAEKYMGRALRTDRFRLVRWSEETASGSAGKVVHQELYDHSHDSGETDNVADLPEYADHLAKLEILFDESFPHRDTPER